MHSASLGGADAPPGALVAFLQKGLQYLELEANLTEVRVLLALLLARGSGAGARALLPTKSTQDGGDVDAGFSLLTAHDLLSRDVDELKALVAARRAQDAGAAARERAARERAAASLGLAPAPAGPAGVKDERGRDEAAAAVAGAPARGGCGRGCSRGGCGRRPRLSLSRRGPRFRIAA